MNRTQKSGGDDASASLVDGGRIVVVFGNGMAPLYYHGDRLIVSDKAPMRIGDRVVVETDQHGMLGGTLVHFDRSGLTLSLGGRSRSEFSVGTGDLRYFGRVVWASQ